MNIAAFDGRITRDIELKKTARDKDVCAFTVAINRSYGKKEADFIPCVAYDGTARLIAQHLGKGSLVGIEGRLQTRTWDGKDGSRRFAMEVIVQNVTFLEPKKNRDLSAAFDEEELTIDSDDLPF